MRIILNKQRIVSITAAALVLILCCLLCRGKEPAPGPEVPSRPEGLNTLITNEMSQRPELSRMDHSIDSFMRYWDLRGGALAIIRGDSLLYAKGYGWADKEEGSEMTPGTLMRIASVSKLMTAVGIMKLVEDNRLALTDTVFGPAGILPEYKTHYACQRQITVEHLLRHQAGFVRKYGDPMFSTLSLMRQHGLAEPPASETMVEKQLRYQLDFQPGTSHYYSNFGYLVLSMIIEKISGQTYEQFMQEQVFHACGCTDFHIAGNYLEDRLPGEARYYMHKDSEDVPEYTGSGNLVPKCYGGNNLAALQGAGAWVCSAVELAKVVASIDGDALTPDIISGKSVATMTWQESPDSFPLGWVDCKEDGEWTRTGSFGGTTAIVKRYPGGETWIFLTNTSTWKGPRFSKWESAYFRKLSAKFSTRLPKQNLFSVSL